MPTHSISRRIGPIMTGPRTHGIEISALLTPKSGVGPSLTPVQRASLDATHLNPSGESCAFQRWILRYGPSLAAHALMFEEGAEALVGGDFHKGQKTSHADLVSAFEQRLKGDVTQSDYCGFSYFFAGSVSTLKDGLYVPPCAASLLGGVSGGGNVRILYMDYDLLNLLYVAEEQGKSREAFERATRFFSETRSVEKILSEKAIAKGLGFVNSAWGRCVELFVDEQNKEVAAGRWITPLGAQSLIEYYGEVIAHADQRARKLLGATQERWRVESSQQSDGSTPQRYLSDSL
jgi:hypothetical protein